MLRASASSTSSSDEPGAAAGAPRAVRAVATIASSCAVTVALLLGWAWHNRAWLQAPILERGSIEAGVLNELRVWRDLSPAVPKAALLGNSLTDCKDGSSVGDLTARRLAARNAPYALVVPWGGAFGPLQYYYLLDDVLAGKPRVVIMEIDTIRLVSTGVSPGLLYLALSRNLSFRRALRVRSALASEGLTLLDPFLYRVEAQLDVMYLVPGVQAHWRELFTRWGAAVNEAAGVRTTPLDARALRMLSLDAARAVVAPDPAESPLVPVLREIAHDLRRAGVTVLFYVSPLNDTLLARSVGGPERRVRQRIDRLRVAVGAAPEEWVDLHDALPSDAFHDWVGHMLPLGCERVSEAIADALIARHVSR